MTSADVREALIQLEDAMGIGRPIGAAELPDEIRFFRVLTALRDILCPRLSQLVHAAGTNAGDVISIIADCIVSSVGKVPIPAVTVAKKVVAIGVDRFCATPTALLEGEDPTVEQNAASEVSDGRSEDRSAAE